jgi:predicted XRE-type DNA-binding protein
MSNGPIAKYSFLPWSRQGIASRLINPDPLDDSLAARVSLPVHLQVNQAHDVNLTLRLYGPGDVIGLDPRQVIRTEPRDQTKDFIPNYFPAVEFARPDLPWLFTPATRGSRSRLRPWISLVVVEKREGVTLRFGRQLVLPILEISDPAVPAEELPHLDDSWAWAHVQVAGEFSPDRSLEQIFAAEPHNISSRLLCPRKLVPHRDYFACLVPAFEAGRQAGLGLPVDDATLAPAWRVDAAPASIQLPVYYHWEFSTGSAGDFEALARLLQARVVPETVGIRPMDISRPGFGMPEIPAESTGRILGLEGALRAPTAERTAWPGDAQTVFQAALREILDAPESAAPKSEPGPVIAPPLYGRWHAAQEIVPVDQPHWFRQLNLDPRERTISGFGTLAVQDQQESLMHSAWEQVEDVVEANRLLMRAQLSRSVGLAILENDLNPLAVSSLLQITRPMHARVSMSPVTLRKLIVDSKVPDAALSNTFRRVARPGGSLARRIYSPDQRRSRPILQRLNAGEIAAAPARSKPAGAITPSEPAPALRPSWLPSWLQPLLKYAFPFFSIVSLLALILAIGLGALGLSAIAVASGAAAAWAGRNSRRWGTAETLETARFSPEEIQDVPERPDFRLIGAAESPPDASRSLGQPPGTDSAEAALFREAAAEYQATIAHTAELAQLPTQPDLALDSIQATLLTRLDPRKTVAARIQGRITIAPDLWEPEDPLEPIMAYPRFDRPMYEALRDISQELLLPGLEAIKPNTVTLLETNPRFIEAYMVGLNHEMARELLWREYLTDQRGSYFRQFWDVRGRIPPPQTPQERELLKDIPEVHRWPATNDLGKNMTGGSIEGRLVLLVRGELLRRFPNSMIYASQAKFVSGPGGQLTRDRTLTEEERYPLFRGTLEPDINFIGFDLEEDEARGDPDPQNSRPGWFLVIQQPPTEPRFGLDVAVEFADTLSAPDSWDQLTWGHLASDQAAFEAMTHIRLEETLPKTGGLDDPPGVSWGENAAHQAFVTLQKPVRIAIHADDMLPA